MHVDLLLIQGKTVEEALWELKLMGRNNVRVLPEGTTVTLEAAGDRVTLYEKNGIVVYVSG